MMKKKKKKIKQQQQTTNWCENKHRTNAIIFLDNVKSILLFSILK